jgi:hypothetical protein
MVHTAPANLWGQLTAKVARLELAVGALSLTVLLLAGVLAWSTVQGVPIHYIPPGGPGVSQPGVMPDAVATDYASRWLMRRYTFTPATVKTAHAEIVPALHPSLSVAFTVQAEREAAFVKEHQLASQVAITTALVRRRAADGVTVALDGTRSVFIGGQQVRDEPLHAELTVVPWVNQGHPAGLVVSRVTITPTLSASGP